jgi:hypothetical protein
MSSEDSHNLRRLQLLAYFGESLFVSPVAGVQLMKQKLKKAHRSYGVLFLFRTNFVTATLVHWILGSIVSHAYLVVDMPPWATKTAKRAQHAAWLHYSCL